ncbi:hypothetical protein [Limnohabitans sp. TS-CS-82]|uniref:hypothetical protein n=1 Tax=Limnohabitans sp. TS-CS-82 TaxID=2094193 RepID=UPI00191BFFD6|nr:hypothetical protein [Limnohabitans sp. TS-CS-82]
MNSMAPILFDRKGLLAEVMSQFRISISGYHGTNHWTRVRHHALTIAKESGADLLVVELFAFLHDSQRINENEDRMHGERAAEYAESLNQIYFDLPDSGLDKLVHAIRFHSYGHVHECVTIQTCWDSDRLDLGRVGIKPNEKYLSPFAAKHIDAAYEWSKLKRIND